nr:MAG TPA: hypothetical protein [Caudoviricetes sp.]
MDFFTRIYSILHLLANSNPLFRAIRWQQFGYFKRNA